MRYLGLFLVGAATVFGVDPAELSQSRIDEIIKTFAENEKAFAEARSVYTYHQTARIQELDGRGNTTGRWETISDIIFDKDNKRTEKVVRAPLSSLHNIQLTPEDLKDLKDIQPFVLTSDSIDKYYVRYLGKEKLDELNCYAFAVKPKKMEKGERYFSGIVWVDDEDLQVVRTYGRGVGVANKEQAFPKFETTRSRIDGKYWFPVYTIAEDTLYFPNGDSQRIRQVVKYEDYKRFVAESKIVGEAEEVPSPNAEPVKPEPAKK
jgi:hypothetical protein